MIRWCVESNRYFLANGAPRFGYGEDDETNKLRAGFSSERRRADVPGGLVYPFHRFRDQLIHDCVQIVGRVKGLELAVGARAALENRVNVLDFFAAAEVVDHVVDEFQQLVNQAREPAPRSVCRSRSACRRAPTAPRATCSPGSERGDRAGSPCSVDRACTACDDRLDQRRESDHLVDSRWDVADAELERRESRMRAHVPPDFLAVVDAAGLEQKVDVVVILGIRAEVVGDVSARELLEDLGAIALQTGVRPHPERRAGREREHVRQEISRGIHQVDLRLAVLDADVDVHAEDQQRLGEHLHFVDQRVVVFVRRDLLIFPARERMRRGRGDAQALALGERRRRCAGA